jgi:hypothetical protein
MVRLKKYLAKQSDELLCTRMVQVNTAHLKNHVDLMEHVLNLKATDKSLERFVSLIRRFLGTVKVQSVYWSLLYKRKILDVEGLQLLKSSLNTLHNMVGRAEQLQKFCKIMETK